MGRVQNDSRPLIGLCNCGSATVATAVVNAYSVTLSHYQNDSRFYAPRTRVEAARFDFQPGDNESDLSKP